MPFRTALLTIALTGPLACTQIPVLEGTRNETAQNAPFPVLVPISGLLAGAPVATRITPETTTDMNARITALRNRATGLNGPVVDADTRSDMRAAIARAALR